MKKTYYLILLLSLFNKALWAASGFQSTIKVVNNVLTFYIRPNADITAGFSVIEFFVRYPNTANLTFSDPIENTTNFPNMGTTLGFEIETGTEGGNRWIHFFYTTPNPTTGTATYSSGVEYAVFSTTVTGNMAPVNLEIVHEVSEVPYYVTLANQVGVDLRPSDAGGNLTSGSLFYPNPSISVSSGKVFHYYALNNVALPLTLLNFTANAEKQRALLTWQTANERSVAHFDIEKSLDGKTFDKIGELKANNTPSVYQAFDNDFTASAYYRLRINDLDGTSTYSKIIFLEKSKILKGIKIYPNPVQDVLRLETSEAQSLDIVNATGQVVAKQFIQKGLTEYNVSHLAAGVYFIKTGVESLRFVKN